MGAASAEMLRARGDTVVVVDLQRAAGTTIPVKRLAEPGEIAEMVLFTNWTEPAT